MVLSLHRWARAALVMLIVAAVGFVSVSPARALQAPSPVSFPSSTYASALSAPIGSRNDYSGFKSSLVSSPKSVPVKTPALSKPGAGAGNALAVLGSFTGSYWLTSQATSKIFDVNTTGDITCDITLLWDPTSPCATSQSPHPEYVPDAGLGPMTPGFDNGISSVRRDSPTYYQVYTITVLEDDPTAERLVLRYDIEQCGEGEAFITRDRISGIRLRNSEGSDINYKFQTFFPSAGRLSGCRSDYYEFEFTGNDYRASSHYYQATRDNGYDLDIKYRSLASPERFEGGSPERWWKTDYECWNPVTNSTRQLVTNSAKFKEIDAQYAALPEMPCSADEILRSGTITQMGVGDGEKVWEYEMPGELADAYEELPAECVDGSCILDLRRVISGTETVSCFSDPDGCVDWYLNPAKEQLFECRYNGQQLPLSECIIYKPTFNPSTQTKGETLGDPTTGATPSTADPESDLGKDPASVPGVSGEGVPGGASAQSRECFPNGWGMLNPYEWFVKPMKCLFIPTQPVSTMVSDATAQLTAAAPGIPALPEMGATVSCPSWKVKIMDFEKEILCDTSFGNALRATRPVFAALMITAAGWPFVRSLWYAAIPLLNVTPTATPTSR